MSFSPWSRPRCVLLAVLAAASCLAGPCPAQDAGGQAPGAAAATAGASVQLASFEQAWSRIREMHYQKDMLGLDWDGVRAELLPRAAAATTAAELRPVLAAMIGKLGESHYQVLPGDAYERLEQATSAASGEAAEAGGGGDLGLDVRVVEGRVAVTRVDAKGPAAAAGVAPGWVLTALGEQELSSLLELAQAAVPDARLARIQANLAAVTATHGAPGSTVTASFERPDGSLARLDLTRRAAPGEVNKLGNLPPLVAAVDHGLVPGTRVGFIHFNIFLTPITARFAEALADLKAQGASGIVIDLRGNPGGIGAMVMGLAGHFIAETGRSLGTMSTRETTLNFVAIPKAASQRFDGPVAVLVDDLSMSTSELLAAGLQGSGRARVFGTTSAGMALPSVIESLPNGDKLQLAIADLSGPDGTRIEGRGVVPDVAVPLSLDSLRGGGDPVLAAAASELARLARASTPESPAAGPAATPPMND